MTQVGLILVSVLPPIALVIYFYIRDRYEPEPRGYVIAAFLYGTLVLIPALLIGQWLLKAVDPEWRALSGIMGRLYDDFIVAALTEEVLKWALFVATIARWHEFDEPFDGVVYGATMALGLASVENVYYVLSKGTWQLALLRGLFSVPGHALYGASMGYFIGRVKFAEGHHDFWIFGPLSLIVPWAFHGAFDHLCSYVGSFWGWTSLSVLSVAMWVFVLVAMGRALSKSPFKDHPKGEEEAAEAAVEDQSEEPETDSA